jgi:L-lactate dehydrogenase complex protein LldG
MIDPESAEARTVIMHSIREHLAASSRYDLVHNEARLEHPTDAASNISLPQSDMPANLINLFKENLEAVEGNCLIAQGESSVAETVREILNGLSRPRVAISDAPFLGSLAKQLRSDVDEITVTPEACELFGYDVGITGAQGAIAETGTLVLQSNCERHRLISLVPPVHISIIEASQLCLTLGEALSSLHRDGGDLSQAITFITGPSRTADIELTLAIGVHGPQKLFVIINTASERSTKQHENLKPAKQAQA